MTDFETLLRDSLDRGAEQAPSTAGLAEGARRRHRQRRRTTLAAGVAAAAVAVGVPLGVAALHDPAPRTPVAVDGSSPGPVTLAEGWRVESFRDVTLTVPGDWRYGGGTDWCANEGRVEPGVVVRPGGAVHDIGCTPKYGHGVTFGPESQLRWTYPPGSVWQYEPGAEEVYPAGSWLGYEKIGTTDVVVVAPDRETAQRIVDSVVRVRGHDPNGCAPREGDDVAQGVQGRLSVCRYSGDHWLEESGTVDRDEWEEALAEAPSPKGNCGATIAPAYAGRVVVGSGGDVGSALVVFAQGCESFNIVSLSGREVGLTPRIMAIALGPGWSGSLGEGVPMPAGR